MKLSEELIPSKLNALLLKCITLSIRIVLVILIEIIESIWWFKWIKIEVFVLFERVNPIKVKCIRFEVTSRYNNKNLFKYDVIMLYNQSDILS